MAEHLAIVGATGVVGREVCGLIGERGLNVGRVSLLASPRGAGTRIAVAGRDIEVKELNERSFHGVDFAIFSAGGECSRRWAPVATSAGAVVIDNSSAFRMDPDVPLVVPEVNPGDLSGHRGIIANPNCSTIIMNVAVWPLHRVNPVKRIVVSTYQAASGAGADAMEELRTQSADFLAGREVVPRIFPHPIAFNLFSHDTPIGPDGYNTEERKMIDETRKIFHDPSLAVTATCIRVPDRSGNGVILVGQPVRTHRDFCEILGNERVEGDGIGAGLRGVYANRLAHLYLLRKLNKLPAELVFIYFLNDKVMGGPTHIDQWKVAVEELEAYLGLPKKHRLSEHVHHIYLDIRRLRNRRT